ncbi:hypothetical protein PT974_04359 [Cladobotryum mycophilum]|uniref:Uncharacterized protein n=1 Tax=Cladobotryum mycophilum TaxID=491253 RepID=A0ABR0SW13_9HYPO
MSSNRDIIRRNTTSVSNGRANSSSAHHPRRRRSTHTTYVAAMTGDSYAISRMEDTYVSESEFIDCIRYIEEQEEELERIKERKRRRERDEQPESPGTLNLTLEACGQIAGYMRDNCCLDDSGDETGFGVGDRMAGLTPAADTSTQGPVVHQPMRYEPVDFPSQPEPEESLIRYGSTSSNQATQTEESTQLVRRSGRRAPSRASSSRH